MKTTSLTLGPFRLRRPLGKGGMGMVWYAEHGPHDHPVAIKVMTAKRARRKRYLEAFMEEVRAVARLDHPNVIQIFDCGVVSEHAQSVTEGYMIAGSPYLAMELASTSLASLDHQGLAWPQVHMILVHLLEGLAHCHARGLIHRDLKPANILFIAEDDASRLKLADFGLVHAMEDGGRLDAPDEAVTGTPRYMAPEQIRGQVRQQGPWTDLYALGCLAYWLTSGTPPFTAGTIQDILQSHLCEPPPPLFPCFEVPDGFGTWARRLLAKDSRTRYRRAADAAAALRRLSGAVGADTTVALHGRDGSEIDVTVVDDRQAAQVVSDTSADCVEPAHQPGCAGDFIDGPIRAPRIPPTWRYQRPATHSNPIHMTGVGLGLYGLRDIPLVGRVAERDTLWNMLIDTRRLGRPQAAILRGPVGIGKTRLADWVAERAHEVGAVNVLTTAHSPISGPSQGIGRIFADFMGYTGLGRDELLGRLRDFYATDGPADEDTLHQCLALSELLARSTDPDYDPDKARIRFRGPEERYVVWRRLLSRLAKDRPLLLVLDDVHWGGDVLQLIRFLFDNPGQRPLPLLTIMTVRSDSLDDVPLASQLLDEIGARPCSVDIPLAPLDDADHDELIRNLLGLQGDLADQVAQRTAGNPLFAIQLVGDWVERGVLEIGPDGFRLSAEESAPLPEDIHHLLVQRLEKLVGHPIDEPAGPGLRALEMAAALGQEVDLAEWAHLCGLAEVGVPAGLLDAMSSHSLANLGAHSWSFAHGALRESLGRIAAEHGRLQAHHRLCAQTIEDLYDTTRDSLASRLAHHLLAAGDDERALPHLLQGIQHKRRTCDFKAAAALIDIHRQTRERLDIGEDDRRTVRCWREEAIVKRHLETIPASLDLLRRCEAIGRRKGWEDELMAQLTLDLTIHARMRGDFDEAHRLADQALRLYRTIGDDLGAALTIRNLGWLHRWKGNHREALRHFKASEETLRELDSPYDRVWSLNALGIAYMDLQRYERAIETIHEALDIFEELGSNVGMANALNGLAECYRHRHELVMAEQHYRRAVTVRKRAGLSGGAVVHFNLGMTLSLREDYGAAAGYFDRAIELAAAEEPAFVGLAHAGALLAAAGLGDWDGFDDHLAEARQHMEERPLVDRDFARCLHDAAHLADEAGHLDRARSAYEMARQQWAALEDHDQLEAIDSHLNR